MLKTMGLALKKISDKCPWKKKRRGTSDGKLPCSRQIDFGRRQKPYVVNLRSYLYGLELALVAAITSEGDEILVVEVSLDSIEIGSQVNGSSEA